ncbi:unnamed protein product [Chrysoparadoxa australica]
MILRAAVLASLATKSCLGEWSIVQSQVLARHGERTRLVKDVNTFEEPLSSVLTPDGEAQCRWLGAYLRDQYIDGEEVEMAAVEGLAAYLPNSLRVDSSDFDRTLASAMAITLGLYPVDDDSPKQTIVPVHSKAVENDVVLRAYDKCPTYADNVSRLYASEEFVAYEAAQGPTLEDIRIALKGSGLCGEELKASAALEEFVNLQDCLQTLEGEDKALADIVLDVSVRQQIAQVAHWVERERYSSKLVGRLLGGNYLRQVVEEFQAKMNKSSPSALALHIASGHYPTMLSVLSAMGLQEQVPGIPGYASHIAIELLEDTVAAGEYGVRVKYQDGRAGDPAITLTLPVATVGVDGVVEWQAFQDYLLSLGALYPDTKEWCLECGNRDAAVCVQGLGSTTLSTSSHASQEDSLVLYVLTSGIISLGIGVMLGLLLSFVRRTQTHGHTGEGLGDDIKL